MCSHGPEGFTIYDLRYSLFWMELLVDNNSIRPSLLAGLMKEADEILALVVSSAKTARTSRGA